MTSYEEILEAANIDDYDESLRRIKSLAAQTLTEADKTGSLRTTGHFNHSYLPDFVMKWPNRPERLIYLRTTSYAEELEDDVVRLADRHPMFLQLSEFRPYEDTSIRAAVESLDQTAGAAETLVTSVPAVGYLEDSPRTGQMLSSLVIRGGRGLVEDTEARRISNTVDAGFGGALQADRASTLKAIEVVEELLDTRATAELTQLFEAAWISGGASVHDFPGRAGSIGENLSSALLSQLLDIVADSETQFWRQIGAAVNLDSFEELHLVGEQTQLQSIMETAATRLVANRACFRRTRRADQKEDPFIWQVDSGHISLRGGGHQVWVATTTPPAAEDSEEYTIDASPTLSQLATRSTNAGLSLAEIGVTDTANISVLFSSPGGSDVAASELVERVTQSEGPAVRVDDVVARVNSKAVHVDIAKAVASLRTSSKVSVSGLVWSGWNVLIDTGEETRDQLENKLGRATEDNDSSDELDPELEGLKDAGIEVGEVVRETGSDSSGTEA